MCLRNRNLSGFDAVERVASPNVLRSAGILASEKHAQWAYYHISEKFCTEHADLYSYLQTNFAAQEPYLSDGKRAALTEKHETC